MARKSSCGYARSSVAASYLELVVVEPAQNNINSSRCLCGESDCLGTVATMLVQVAAKMNKLSLAKLTFQPTTLAGLPMTRSRRTAGCSGFLSRFGACLGPPMTRVDRAASCFPPGTSRTQPTMCTILHMCGAFEHVVAGNSCGATAVPCAHAGRPRIEQRKLGWSDVGAANARVWAPPPMWTGKWTPTLASCCRLRRPVQSLRCSGV